MTLSGWIIIFLVQVLFWIWVIRWGGAERLEGTFTSGFLISWLAPRWSAEGIKLFAWLSLIAGTAWFFAGLFYPELRFF